MNNYIDLNRKFIKYDSSSYNEQDDWTYSLSSWNATITWEDILKYKCSIILAEAGSGKTKELQHMTDKLKMQGKKAFFCNISNLATMSSFGDAIGFINQQEFVAWKQGDEPGYFFLDSVDEAKLREPKDFEIALRKFANALGSQLIRAHIVISSRPVRVASYC